MEKKSGKKPKNISGFLTQWTVAKKKKKNLQTIIYISIYKIFVIDIKARLVQSAECRKPLGFYCRR